MKKKILIIDDEKEMVQVETMRLHAYGYDVVAAYDGESGLRQARVARPHLIILDIMLPKIGGYELCRMLKQDADCRNIPIILVSAVDQKFDTDLGKKVGADDYFTKPFDPASLLAKIKELTKNQGI
jgi:DNA-binding response OmpR family regulator